MIVDASFEPYVADPAEPRPLPRLARLRPWIATAVLLLLALAVVALVLAGAREDPALQLPSPAPSAND